jgi:hypothetical protein
MKRPVVTKRRGGTYEAAGFVIVVVGLLLLFTGWPLLGGLISVAGFIVFLVGRFM